MDVKRALSLSKEDAAPLFEKAAAVTRENFGDFIDLRAIIEIGNGCKRSCGYCGLNKNSGITRYRMDKNEITELAVESAEAGFKTVILQSGEDGRDTAELVEIISEIKKIPVTLTLSLGERPFSDFEKFRAAGADRYLLKHETADPALYKTLHPDSSLEKRTSALRELKRLGYLTGSGFMVGLPGQDATGIAADVLLLKELDLDMAGIGPFLPSSRTNFKNALPGDPFLVKKAVAVARILLPKILLPATTGLGVLNRNERDKLFDSGANVLMKSVTPKKYRDNYEIYDAGKNADKTPKQIYDESAALIESLGRKVNYV